MNYELIAFIITMFFMILFFIRIVSVMSGNSISFLIYRIDFNMVIVTYPSLIYQIYWWTIYLNLIQ